MCSGSVDGAIGPYCSISWIKPFRMLGNGVWGVTEQKVHLSPAPSRTPTLPLVCSERWLYILSMYSPFRMGRVLPSCRKPRTRRGRRQD